MEEQEIKDLSRYFRLSDYRDGDYFLEEEYYEFQEIIKRSPIAQELEEARYQSIIGKISEAQYQEKCMKYFNDMCVARKKKAPVKQLGNSDNK